MMKITEIVENLNINEKTSIVFQKKIVIIVIDVSGSTGNVFAPGINIMEKEQEIVMNHILKNLENHYYIYSFDSAFNFHGKCNVMIDEQFVQLPAMRPGSCTNTANPLLDICKQLDILKPDIVKLYTDGQTHSSSQDLLYVSDIFRKENIKFEVTAVANSNTDMESITRNEETNIPGMELVNMLGNHIDFLEIYNNYHHTVPYIGMIDSSVKINKIEFMRIDINISVIEFLRELINKIDENKTQINWGTNSIDFKKMLSEIGKLWSLIVIEFDEQHPYIINTVERLESLLSINDFSTERIIKIIKYGFSCTKNNKPILMTNFEEKIKESTTKHNEFSSAIELLNTYGTTLNSNKIICMPNTNGSCIIMNKNTISLMTESKSNLSRDKYGNIYFGIDTNPQAVRIGMREFAEKLGFPNSRASPSVIFITLNQMLLMFINGENLDSDYMIELRKIGIAQTSMEGMINKGKYDGVGFYTKWKNGIIPPMHYSNPKTHTSLAIDKMINPLLLPETIWWATMMSMLGIFDEQLGNYKSAIETFGIEATQNNFLQFIKTEYVSKIQGHVETANINPNNKSIFTLDNFSTDEQVFIFKNHHNSIGQNCCANTWYSQNEIDEYININGCVWCREKPKTGELEQINFMNPNIKLDQINANSSSLKVIMVYSDTPKDSRSYKTATSSASLSSGIANLSMSSISSGTNKFRINLIGITGAGKSTTAEIMKQLIEGNGGQVIIVNADKYSKFGITGKILVKKIKQDIDDFNYLPMNGFKVIIMDLCNENGPSNTAFNFNFSEYTDLNFYPQLNKDMINEYEAWCLKNVISRPKHDYNSTYWLNPVVAGLNTCIKVHNMKNNKFRQFINCRPTNNNFKENDSMDVINNKINKKAGIYANYLATIDINDVITKFLSENNLLR